MNTEQLIKSDGRNLVAGVEAISKKNSENGLMPIMYKGAVCCLLAYLPCSEWWVCLLLIISGMLFLFLAALLLAKVSSRFDALLHNNENMRTWRRRWDTSNALPLPQRVKLSLLSVARAVVNDVETAINSLNKTRADS
jgi:hypothetical protein